MVRNPDPEESRRDSPIHARRVAIGSERPSKVKRAKRAGKQAASDPGGEDHCWFGRPRQDGNGQEKGHGRGSETCRSDKRLVTSTDRGGDLVQEDGGRAEHS